MHSSITDFGTMLSGVSLLARWPSQPVSWGLSWATLISCCHLLTVINDGQDVLKTVSEVAEVEFTPRRKSVMNPWHSIHCARIVPLPSSPYALALMYSCLQSCHDLYLDWNLTQFRIQQCNKFSSLAVSLGYKDLFLHFLLSIIQISLKSYPVVILSSSWLKYVIVMNVK